jgi:hypothetical protein
MIAMVVRPKSATFHELPPLIRWNLRIPLSHKRPSSPPRPPYPIAQILSITIILLILTLVVIVAKLGMPSSPLRSRNRPSTLKDPSQSGMLQQLENLLLGYCTAAKKDTNQYTYPKKVNGLPCAALYD